MGYIKLAVGARVGVLVPGTALAPGIVVRRYSTPGGAELCKVQTEHHGVVVRLAHSDYVGPYTKVTPEIEAAWGRIQRMCEGSETR